MGTFFHLSGLSKKSVGSKGSSRKLWAFPPVTWLDPVSARVVNVLHVLELKVQMWARLRLSAFQRQPGSGVRQICRQVILAQCDESSDSMDTPHLCDVEDWKERCTCAWSETTKYRNLMWDVGFPGGSVVKESTCQCRRHRFGPWSRKIPYVEQLSLCTTTVGPVL